MTDSYHMGFKAGQQNLIDQGYEEIRHGRWVHYEHREPQYDLMGVKTWAEAYKCSNCGFIHSVIEDFGHYAFCPNCGAKMEVETEWNIIQRQWNY